MLTKDNVLLMKLTNGLDCIGTKIGDIYASEIGGHPVGEPIGIIFKKLRILAYRQEGPHLKIGFELFLIPSEDADIPIEKKDILCCIDAPLKIADGYLNAISPIQRATSMPTRGNIIDGKLVQ